MQTIELSVQEIRNLRLCAQQLSVDTETQNISIEKILQTNCGVQAQYPSDAALALHVRMNNLTSKDLKKILIDERTIVRTWCMRGTLHFLAAEDFHWLIGLHGKIFIQKSQRRYEQLGIDEKLYDKCIEKLHLLFSQSEQLTRDEVKDYLMMQGIKLEGQAPYHLLRRAALDGLICFGPDRKGEPTYVLVDNWLKIVPQQLSKEEAIDKLVRRYLEAYGPASLADFANWSGLPMKTLRQGWKSVSNEMIEVKNGEQRLYMLEKEFLSNKFRIVNSSVLLVPAYDTYLLGYQNRELILAPYAEKDVYRGGGLLRPAIVINGYIVGSWEIKHYQRRIVVRINALPEIVEPVQKEINLEVQKMGKFFGMPAELIL
ncbi:winged helix DNA-binding domain-containing protein [Bacillus atrophaeus]|uniref:winged helix DNA-binding domain-containing protein n=1 Tax=Bacillus atrophaeus TaxID=1452 RepID=UPI00227FD0B8|nr:winged helix DNA-binding domain-containing protein [Bacillus atrophaeus]MCY9165981.1 winged helix DNA-binding domain-containing protein [Bacillus atrophaeus]